KLIPSVEPQHIEELVEWITKLSSSSSSSVTQAKTSLAVNATAKATYSFGSMASVTPSLAPPSCPEESPELFDQSVRYMLQEDAQHFEGSNDGTQVEDEGSNMSPERGGAQEGQETGSHVPSAAAYCQVSSSGEEGGMMRHSCRSYNASAWLADLQKECNLPKNRLICDMPTRWNSTLAMLQWLRTQQRVINEYLCEYGTRTGSGELFFATQVANDQGCMHCLVTI
ncbi:hypothetical protein AB205_0186950, partial [Aquarana catesbeiana]